VSEEKVEEALATIQEVKTEIEQIKNKGKEYYDEKLQPKTFGFKRQETSFITTAKSLDRINTLSMTPDKLDVTY
jgi:hypothetical protein